MISIILLFSLVENSQIISLCLLFVRVPCIRWFFNPKLLTFVDTSTMAIQDGDFVLVLDSYAKVKALQDSAHGGWNEKMREVKTEII